MKDKIIFNVFEFIETGDTHHSNLAKEFLKTFAKKYHIKIKDKRVNYNTKEAFKDFILNGKGYNETIQRLYNSL